MKKRILSLALAVALMAISVAGTYAYLTDSDQQTNTFTSGNVYIELDEAVVENVGGNLVAKGDERTSDPEPYHLFPGMTVTKDPTIHIQADSEDAYVAAKVTITGNLSSLKNGENALVDADGKLNVNLLLSGGLLTGNGCTIEQVAGTNTWTLYIYVTEAYAKSETVTDIVVFDTLTIPAEWDNTEMDLIETMEITIEAYAVQANGLANCKDAMAKAFSDEFSIN